MEERRWKARREEGGGWKEDSCRIRVIGGGGGREGKRVSEKGEGRKEVEEGWYC